MFDAVHSSYLVRNGKGGGLGGVCLCVSQLGGGLVPAG